MAGDANVADERTADHLALRDVALTYATACDRRDPDLFVSAFLPDARLRVYRPSYAPAPEGDHNGHDALRKIPAMLGVYTRTYHFVGNASYDIGDDVATGEVYCMAHHLTAARHGGTNFVIYIRYQDVYRRDPAGAWKIADRRVLIDWTDTRTADPSAR